MSDKQPSRRVQFTKNALRNAFIDLTAEKPLGEITVTDICARADINRSTFYLHYQGVYELLHEIEGQIINHIRSNLAPPKLTVEEFAAFLNHLKVSPRLRALMTSLLGEQGDPQFIRQLQTLTYELFQQGWNHHNPEDADGSEGRKRLIYSYMVGGIVFSLSSWVNDDIPDLNAEETIRLLGRLISHGMSSILPIPPDAADMPFCYYPPHGPKEQDA